MAVPLAAIVVVLSNGTAETSARHRSCPGPDTNYADPFQTYDPGLDCFIELLSGEGSDAASAVQDVGESEGGQSCRDIEDNLESNTEWWEWVGYYSNWDAATRFNEYDIGFHLDSIDDVGLWAHEGTHALGDWDEGPGSCAEYYQAHCPHASECGPQMKPKWVAQPRTERRRT